MCVYSLESKNDKCKFIIKFFCHGLLLKGLVCIFVHSHALQSLCSIQAKAVSNNHNAEFLYGTFRFHKQVLNLLA